MKSDKLFLRFLRHRPDQGGPSLNTTEDVATFNLSGSSDGTVNNNAVEDVATEDKIYAKSIANTMGM